MFEIILVENVRYKGRSLDLQLHYSITAPNQGHPCKMAALIFEIYSLLTKTEENRDASSASVFISVLVNIILVLCNMR